MTRMPTVGLGLSLFASSCAGRSPAARADASGGANATTVGGSAGVGGAGNAAGNGIAGAVIRPVSLLVFSRTLGYRHASIEAGIGALHDLAIQRDWLVTTTEDPARFSDVGLADFNVLVFLSTTGDVLDETQQDAMQRFIQAGNGFVGVHSASDTEYDWPWYGELVGAYFERHPVVQPASILVETANHPATATLPTPWARTDEWYAFRSNPRERVTVLLRLDETSYVPGDAGMGSDHPIAWSHEFDGGRAFYTALGHTESTYREPEFLGHLLGGIEWAARRAP